MSDTSIKFAPNGPILVAGKLTLENSSGEREQKEEMTALCRCGASMNKPYCDGAHTKAEFSDKNESDGSKNFIKNFEGNGVEIRYNKELCSHAAICSEKLPSVFNPGQDPWIQPQNSEKELIIRTIEKCPSGALSYKEGQKVTTDFGLEEAKIKVAKDGPYYVEGAIPLQGASIPETCSKEHYALCRCGKSKNKPFCDGYHYDIGFKAD